MAQQNEASVEEILESIKKVIARDNREDAAAARKQREADADAVEERAQDADESGADNTGILDLAEMELENEAGIEEGGGKVSDADNFDSLVREEARNAMKENLSALATLAAPGAKPQIVRSGETSLEGLTRELLRPMLAEWLDKNLPGMVEELVQAEIARIVGKHR